MTNTESTDLLGRASSSVAALTHTAHDLVGMLLRAEQQPEADGSLASLTRTVQAGSDAHWAVVARAAASLDAAAAESGATNREVELLTQQRRELQEVACASPHPTLPVRSATRHLFPGGVGSKRRDQAAGRHAAPTDVRRAGHGRAGGRARGKWGGAASRGAAGLTPAD